MLKQLLLEADAAFASKGFPSILQSTSAGSTLPIRQFHIQLMTKKKRLLRAVILAQAAEIHFEVFRDHCQLGLAELRERLRFAEENLNHTST